MYTDVNRSTVITSHLFDPTLPPSYDSHQQGDTMKFVFAFILLLTAIAFSEPFEASQIPAETPRPFGAFTYGNYLYVTIPGDCNKQGAHLEVSSLCNKNRLTRNLALSCEVNLNIVSTLMYCTTMVHAPKVFMFDLANEPIAPEARELVIQSGSHSITVPVNR